MHPVPSFNKIPLFARVLLVGAGLAVVLMLALPARGRGRRLRSMTPPSRSPTAAGLPTESHPKAGPLSLTSLLVGPEPHVLVPGRRVASTFITDDGVSCHVMATAQIAGSGPVVLQWSVVAPVGFMVPVEANWTGSRLDVVLRRPGGNPSGLGGPLSLTVKARAQVNGQEATAAETVIQDERDQLRQEYVDLARHTVPDRSEFVDAAAFSARYGRRFPWLHFEDLNWSVHANTQTRYSYAILRPELLEGLDQVRRAYGGIVISSGYRNPVHQVEVHAPVRESLHQYGYAADLAVIPGEGRSLPNEVDWRRLAEAACSARARWIEPLASSAPNSPGCHVHVDYRPGPVSSAPVRLHGQVVEAATGRPIAGALVLLGAMPARTDANGIFGIRNVLSGGPHPVQVRADGFEPLDQPVPLVAWGSAFVRLELQPALHPAFTIEVARAHWVDRKAGVLAAALRVSNTGAGAVSDVRVSVAPSQALLISQEPPALGSLAVGAVRGVGVVVRVPPGQMIEAVRIAVTVAYQGASGGEQRAQIALSVLPPGAPPLAGTLRVVKKPAEWSFPAPLAIERTPAAAAPQVAPVRPARPNPTPPSAHLSETPKAVGPAENVSDPKLTPGKAPAPPESMKSPAPADHPAEPAPAAASGGDAGKPANPAPPPSTAPAAPGSQPKAASPGETKPLPPAATAGAATPADPH